MDGSAAAAAATDLLPICCPFSPDSDRVRVLWHFGSMLFNCCANRRAHVRRVEKNQSGKLQDTNIADRQVQILMYLWDTCLLCLLFVSAFALIFCLLGGKYQS